MEESPSGCPTVSFKALQRARTTIEDFSLSYFPLHGLTLPDDFFTYMDVLVYVEATMYQLDEHNELLAGRGISNADYQLPGVRNAAQLQAPTYEFRSFR